MENNKPKERTSSFKLKNFIRQKVLGINGINKAKSKDDSSKAKNVDGLMPHDNTKT